AQRAAVVERRDQQQPARRRRQLSHLRGERVLEPGGQGQPGGQQRAGLELGGGDRELDERERIAGRLGQQARADVVREIWRNGVQQLRGGRVVESLEAQ